MSPVRALFGACCLLAVVRAPEPMMAAEPVVVRNDDHEVRLVRVELRGGLHNGMVRPPSEDEAFLLVFLETADPCFDFVRNQGCFPEFGDLDELDKVAWACGEVTLREDDTRPAHGGGQLADGLACSYLIPISAPSVRLTLRGYPETQLSPAP